MNIKAQIILNKHLNNIEIGDANRHIINAMKEFASNYHKEQLSLYDVVKSFCECGGEKRIDSKYCDSCNRHHSI